MDTINNKSKRWRRHLVYIKLELCRLQGDANRTNPVHNTASPQHKEAEKYCITSKQSEAKVSCVGKEMQL